MHIHTHALRLKRAERVRETGWEHVGTEGERDGEREERTGEAEVSSPFIHHLTW